MNTQYLKDKPAVQFAIGITVILIVGTWFITGDLPFVSSVLFQKPVEDAEGNTQALPSLVPIFMSMGFQAVCWVGASFIALVSGVWSMIVGGRKSTPTESSSSPQTSSSLADASFALCKAAEDNDLEAMETNRIIIRLPKAMRLHQEAILDSNLEAADVLMEELRTLINPSSVKTSGRKAKS